MAVAVYVTFFDPTRQNMISKQQDGEKIVRERRKYQNTHTTTLRTLVALLTITAALFIAVPAAGTVTKGEIDAGVKATLKRFQIDVKGGGEYLKAAKGVLIMPNVSKAGFVVGGQFGQGVLQVEGKNVQYYNLVEGSLGYQIGAEQYDMVIIFMTDEMLNKFRKSEGWEAGVDAEVTLIAVGAEISVETLRSQHPVAGFVFDQKGLMAGISLKGAKFSRIHPK